MYSIKKGSVMVGLVQGVKYTLISTSFLKKKYFLAHWGQGGCWGCRGQGGCKGCWGQKITRYINPKYSFYFSEVKKWSRSSRSRRSSWLMRSLRPVNSSESLRYSSSWTRWPMSCNFMTWKIYNYWWKFLVENGILQKWGCWGQAIFFLQKLFCLA